jgi:hypothetical protein
MDGCNVAVLIGVLIIITVIALVGGANDGG